MPFPVIAPQPSPASEPPALIRTVAREDVRWNRPVFKAPPLELHPQAFDPAIFAHDLRRIGLLQR